MAFRRPRRRTFSGRPVRRGAIGRHPHPGLIGANKLFSEGEYEESAKLFGEIAGRVFSHRGPRAPQLFFQAG